MCSSNSFVYILSEYVGESDLCLVCTAPHTLMLASMSSLLFLAFSAYRALQDVQIRFQPQSNPDVVAPLPTHTTHEDFGE